jgi:hypothetical protein
MTLSDFFMLGGFFAVITGLANEKSYLVWVGLAMETVALYPQLLAS